MCLAGLTGARFAESPQLPVPNFDAFVDRALTDPSDMAHFFRILADPTANGLSEVDSEPDQQVPGTTWGQRSTPVTKPRDLLQIDPGFLLWLHHLEQI